MIYTEAEAKTKECRAIPPTVDMAEARPTEFTSVDRTPLVRPLKCSGSACMLWQTTEIKFEDFVIDQNATKIVRPVGEGWRLRTLANGQIAWSRPVAVAGHCGLIK